MRKGYRIIAAITILGLLFAGCATTKAQRYSGRDSAPTIENPDRDIYYGHPLRLIAFPLHAVGVILDYVVVKPLYFVFSLAPGVFGFTEEDERGLKGKR